MSESNRTFLAEIDGVKYYTNGIVKGNLSVSGSIFYVNFGKSYDAVTGSWGDGSAFGGGDMVTFEVDDSGNIRVGGSAKGFEGGVVRYADGTYGFFAGASISLLDDFLSIGVDVDGTLTSHGTNLSSYNTINVYPDGRVQSVQYFPGNSEYNYVMVQVTTKHKDGKVTVDKYSVGDPQVAADLAAGLMPHLYNQKCFPAGTLISMADGTRVPIEDIAAGDEVVSFQNLGGALVGKVVRTFRGEADAWVDIYQVNQIRDPALSPILTATPGHYFLTPDGSFKQLKDLLELPGGAFEIVGEDGNAFPVTGEIRFKPTGSERELDGMSTDWKTFNFEVEETHTYIANGIRVHNDSLFLPQTWEAKLAQDIIEQITNTIFDRDWQKILIGSALSSFGTVALDSLLGDDDFGGELLLGRYSLNVIDNVGGYAGRALVAALLENADIDPALGSALSIFAQQAGSNLAQLAALEFLAANAGGVVALEAQQALNNSSNGFNFSQIISSAGFAALGSYAGSQLADLLELDPELAALVAAPAQAAIVTIGDNIVAGNAWNLGVSSSMLTSLGSVAGTIVANNIGNFDTYTEQMGSNIGSKIGAFVFSSLGPVGTFIGSLLGGLLGGVVGGIFGDDPEGFADIEFSTFDDLYRITKVYGEDRAHKDVARDLAESHISVVKSILELIDGDVLAGNVARLTFGYVEKDFSVKIDGHEYNLGSDAKGTIDVGVFEALRSMQIAGGDVYARRAMHATMETYKNWSTNGNGATAVYANALAGNASQTSSSDALNQLMSALMIAKEYQNYLKNISEINAIIAADPKSDFSVGWQMTLAQVFALGLQQRSEIDWTGGWNWWLQHNAVTSDKVTFSYLDSERVFVLGTTVTKVVGDTIAPGQKNTVSGGDSADYIFIDGSKFDGDASQSGKTGEFVGFNGFDRAGQTEIGFAARINGGGGDDQIYGGDLGNDLFGGAGDDLLVGGKLDDWLFGGEGNDVLLAGGGLGDVLDGGFGNDRLLGDDSEDWLSGGTGDDILQGFAGNDVLEGGAGRDVLIGGDGADRYIFRADSGIDVITDSGTTGSDVIVFGNGILPSDLIVQRSTAGDDLVVRIKGVDSALLVITGGLLTDFNGIERFEFADGSVWSKSRIISAITQDKSPSLTIPADSASTAITGTTGDDDLAGGGGDDVIQGGVGSDTYRFNLGDGSDKIIDVGLTRDIDRVVFGSGIIPADLVLSRTATDSSLLEIGIAGTADKLSISYANPDFADGIELFEFADGTRLSYRELNKLYINQHQTSGNDILVGSFSDEILSGGKGNDTLRGGGGFDKLMGGEGNDTYIYNRGDGNVVISDYYGIDKLVLGAGITSDSIHLSVSYRDVRAVVITFRGMPGRIELLGQLSDSYIEEIEFSDGTLWSAQTIKDVLLTRATDRNGDQIFGGSGVDTLYGGSGGDRIHGSSGDDTLFAGTGDDVLIGGKDSDTYHYNVNDGNDVIVEGQVGGERDKVVFGAGISLSELSYSKDPFNTYNGWITFQNGARLSLLNLSQSYYGGIELLQTADGTVLNQSQLLDLFRSSWASSGKDIIRGFYVADTINAGSGDDRVYGYEGNDLIRGGTGNDVLIGGAGDDTYYYNIGDGNDVIVEGSYWNGIDKLIFGEGISLSSLSYSQDPFSAYDGWITFGDGSKLSLLQLSKDSNNGIELLQTADGTVLNQSQLLDLFRSSWASTGKDIIRGFYVADTINAGSGDDRVYGYEGNDLIRGGAGDDVLIGGAGDDTYYYNIGDGNDVIVEDSYWNGIDKLVFGQGISLSGLSYSQDPISTYNGWITFGDGTKLSLLGLSTAYEAGIESIQTADGTVLNRSQLLDLFRSSWSGAGKDIIRGFYVGDTMNGGDGDDRIYGYEGNDFITGGSGDDVLLGGAGDDTYYYNTGDGNDVIVEAGSLDGNDKLVFGNGIRSADLKFSFDTSDTDTLRIHLLDGSTITIKDAFGSYEAGIESFVFADGSSWNRSALAAAVGRQAAALNIIKGNTSANTLVGTSGGDYLDGLSGADTIRGGAGDDFADGGLDNDIYLFDKGDGRDVFFGNSGTDTLKFASGIKTSDINVSLYEINHAYLTLRIAGTADEITIRDVEKIEFADGTIWTEAQLYQVYLSQNSTSEDDFIETYDGHDVINTGAGDDRILAGEGNDVISGGTGDDYAYGFTGDDVYIFNKGDGRDVFDGGLYGSTDTLRFGAGIGASDIAVGLMESDHSFLTLRIRGTTDEISITDVEKVEFADGTIWTEAQLYQVYVSQNSTSGEDFIETYDGHDIINTGAGDDRIFAGGGDDVISGGAGDDYAYGYVGNDVYIFNKGDGRDVFDGGSYGTDTLRFGAGISASDIAVGLMESDHSFLTLKIKGTTDEISISDVEKVEFADGTSWTEAQLYQVYVNQNSTSGDDFIETYDGNDVISTGAGDDRIEAGYGNDVISGGAGDDYANGYVGDDVYIFNRADGRDVFDGGTLGNDVLRFGAGILVSDIAVGLTESDHSFLTLKIKGTNDEISITDVEKVQFADGTVWTEAQLYQVYANQNSTSGDDFVETYDSNDVINSGAGDDRIIAGYGKDVISGGAGDDYADGSAGNDVYIFNRGDGHDVFEGGVDNDTIRFGATISLGDLRIYDTGSYWTTIFLPDTGDIIEVYSVEFVEFADGTRYSLSDLPKTEPQSATSAGTISGTSANDILVGTTASDTLQGFGGDDRLSGGRGGDTYVFRLGDGHDTVEEDGDNASTDTLQLGSGIAVGDVFFEEAAGNQTDLILRLKSREETITLKNQLSANGAGIERILFANGTTWTRDKISVSNGGNLATAGDDVLTGTFRADLLRGGAGNDYLKGGLGADRYIYALGDGNDRISDLSSAEDIDELAFDFSYSGSGVRFQRTSDGTSLLITVGGATIVVDDQLGTSGYGVDLVTFTSGERFNRDAIETLVLQASMTSGNDNILGTANNDLITGAAGDDVLDGKEGSDTYYFGVGDGHDVVKDGGQLGGSDAIVFQGISSTSIKIFREAEGLYRIYDGSGGWSVTLAQGFGGVEEFRFGDGINLTQSGLKQKYYDNLANENSGTILGDSSDEIIIAGLTGEVIRGGAGNDEINGGGGNDIIFGDAGNDTLRGGDGDDRLEGGLGLDHYDGGSGSDTVDFRYSSAEWEIDLLSGTAKTLANPEGVETLVSIERVVMGAGHDILRGSDADDFLDAGSGNDILSGGKGNDVLIGGAGADELVGGDGDDEIQADADDKWFSGGNGIDTLFYTGTNDFQYALAPGEFENIKAGSGNNTIWGSEENNTIFGEIGDDYLFGYGGNDVLIGGAGADELVGGDGDDEIHADARDKWFSGGNGVDTVIYSGTNNLQYALAPGGFENIKAGAGNNTIWGSEDKNTISGEDGDDYLFGYGGNDVLIGGAGADELVGGDGDDEIHADAQDKWFSGGNGIDTLIYTGTNNFQYALAVGEFENVKAGAGNNTIWGTEGNNTISGESGDDYLFGYGGDDILIGGAGADELVGGDGNDEIHADAEDKWVSGGNGIDTLIYTGTNNSEYALGVGEFENVKAGAGNNTVWGTSEANLIDGEAGNDTLFGYEGDDILIGGTGTDELTGGAGNDNFVFKPNFGLDTITDFQSGAGSVDVLEFDTSLFADFEAVLAAAAQVGNDTVITYDASNTVTLKNVALTSLHEDDVRFVA